MLAQVIGEVCDSGHYTCGLHSLLKILIHVGAQKEYSLLCLGVTKNTYGMGIICSSPVNIPGMLFIYS